MESYGENDRVNEDCSFKVVSKKQTTSKTIQTNSAQNQTTSSDSDLPVTKAVSSDSTEISFKMFPAKQPTSNFQTTATNSVKQHTTSSFSASSVSKTVSSDTFSNSNVSAKSAQRLAARNPFPWYRESFLDR
jgi:hypothetical protein